MVKPSIRRRKSWVETLPKKKDRENQNFILKKILPLSFAADFVGMNLARFEKNPENDGVSSSSISNASIITTVTTVLNRYCSNLKYYT